MNPDKPLATPAEVAEYLGVSTGTLAKMRMRDGDGPVYIFVNTKTIRYEWPAVHEWITERARTSTDGVNAATA